MNPWEPGDLVLWECTGDLIPAVVTSVNDKGNPTILTTRATYFTEDDRTVPKGAVWCVWPFSIHPAAPEQAPAILTPDSPRTWEPGDLVVWHVAGRQVPGVVIAVDENSNPTVLSTEAVTFPDGCTLPKGSVRTALHHTVHGTAAPADRRTT